MMNEQTRHRLISAASKIRARAYAPYSNIRVGAALLCRSGKIVSGANVENAAFGLSLCAERIAIAKALADGEKEFIAIAICASTWSTFMPCGACLQVLAEFCDLDLEIWLGDEGRPSQAKTLGDLLPYPFKLQTRTEMRRIPPGEKIEEGGPFLPG